jgi:hypothetical protein
VHAAGTKPPTQWRARRRPLGPAPSVRSAGDFRVCGRYTIPGASRSRSAQERARRPIASHTRSVLNLGRVYCPVPVHRRRVPHRAPSRPVHDSGRKPQPGDPGMRPPPIRVPHKECFKSWARLLPRSRASATPPPDRAIVPRRAAGARFQALAAAGRPRNAPAAQSRPTLGVS